MSFILEALKKVERQHAQANSRLTHAHQVGFQSKQRWPWLVTLLITAGAMLSVGILLGRSEPADKAAVTSQPQVAAPVIPAPTANKIVGQKPAVPASEVTWEVAASQTEPEAPAGQAAPNEQMINASAVRPEMPSITPEPKVKPQKPKPVQSPPQTIDVTALPGVPPHLPDMHIDIHSMSQENPARSYVLINMERYHKNDRLNNGLVVIDIVKEGVVMEYQGEKFLLRL